MRLKEVIQGNKFEEVKVTNDHFDSKPVKLKKFKTLNQQIKSEEAYKKKSKHNKISTNL